MPPLLSVEEMNALDSGDEFNDEHLSTDMLEDICDRSQSHTNIHRREACYKIRDGIKQKQTKWKVALKATRSMGKGLHKVLKTAVKEML